MKRDWQSGDVAMVTTRGATRPAVKGALHGWYWPGDYLSDDDVADARPLAVIDPEDRGQVERLVVLLGDHGWRPTEAHGLRDALREFANPTPPKPDEPSALYARVEDAEGCVWVRTATQASVWRQEWVNSDGFRYLIPQDGHEDYADIDAVRVLSEGVTAHG